MTWPLGSAISIDSQLTCGASFPSRNGSSDIQRETLLAALDRFDPLVKFDAGEIFGQRRMGVGLARTGSGPGGKYGLADWLAGVEITFYTRHSLQHQYSPSNPQRSQHRDAGTIFGMLGKPPE